MNLGKLACMVAAALSFYTVLFILISVYTGLIEPKTRFLVIGLFSIYIVIMSLYDLKGCD